MLINYIGNYIIMYRRVFVIVKKVSSVKILLPLFPSNVAPITMILAIVVITPFLFVGFDSIPQAVEEYDFYPKLTFKLMITAIGFGFLMYVAVNTITAIGFLYTSISSYKVAKKHNEFKTNKWIKVTSLLGIIG